MSSWSLRRTPWASHSRAGRAHQVASELRGEREQVDPTSRPRHGSPDVGDQEDDGRPDGEPGVAEHPQQALRVQPRREHLGQAVQRQRGHDDERHDRRRQHEQHRHEDELRRDHEARPGLELRAGRSTAAASTNSTTSPARHGRVETDHDQQHGDDDERQAHERVGPQLARLHGRPRARTRRLHEPDRGRHGVSVTAAPSVAPSPSTVLAELDACLTLQVRIPALPARADEHVSQRSAHAKLRSPPQRTRSHSNRRNVT